MARVTVRQPCPKRPDFAPEDGGMHGSTATKLTTKKGGKDMKNILLVSVPLFVVLFLGIVALTGGFRERAVGASYLALVAGFALVVSIVVGLLVYRFV